MDVLLLATGTTCIWYSIATKCKQLIFDIMFLVKGCNANMKSMYLELQSMVAVVVTMDQTTSKTNLTSYPDFLNWKPISHSVYMVSQL